MSQLNAYLQFGGNCREAMTFYQQVFGGELQIMAAADSPMGAQTPDEYKHHVMHSYLHKGNIHLMGSDNFGRGEIIQGNSVTLALVCSSKEDIETFYARLSEGATIGNALKEEFFGTYADLTDKFGFNWLLQYQAAPQGA